MEDRTFIDRAGEFFSSVGESVRDGFDWVAERAQREGAYNYLIAVPGALLGFLFTQNAVGSWFGGGLISQIAAFPLAITAGLVSAVFMAQGFNAALGYAQETFDIGAGSEAPAEQAVAASVPAIEEEIFCEAPYTPNLVRGTCERAR